MSGLAGVGSVLEEAGGSGLGLTSSSSAYVRLSSCDARGCRKTVRSAFREAKRGDIAFKITAIDEISIIMQIK